MNAIEFQAEMKPDRTLRVPDGVAQDIPTGRKVKVIILFAPTESDADWERLSAAEFGSGYADSDSIYDQLSGR